MFEHYYREILRFLSGRIADRSTAADLAQESYVRVYAAQTAGTSIDDPRALLYRIARNLLVDHHRHTALRAEVEIPTDDDVVTTVQGPKGLEPEIAAASRQGVMELVGVIDGLPPRCRQAFMLNRFDGLSYAQVAAEMGISVKMVEQHIKHALDACEASRWPAQGAAPRRKLNRSRHD
ncbi:RNA polymerase sigma factor, sigma-70 family [Herbaspirillum sp. YR522]|nr:RNA polymerase sigma factor, sigma-70 family [Herbaspirillum sp. YR522]